MSNFYALIMAGGSGTRLWPLSRSHRPKQALRLVGDRTMFQHAVDRLQSLLPADRVLVVTAREYVPVLSEQVPEIPSDNYIVEPMARGTAGAIGLASIHLQRRDRSAVMAVLTADHYIERVDRFRAALAAAVEVANAGHVVTLGIQPTYPSTGFGYIRRRLSVDSKMDFDVYPVEALVEKPDLDRATKFVDSGLYSWNSGMFIWQVERIMGEFKRQMPGLHRQLQAIGQSIGQPDYERVVSEVWPQVQKQTIDYGIMEHCPDVMVIPVDIGGTDIGDWEAVYRLRDPKSGENVSVGAELVEIDTAGTLVQCDQATGAGKRPKIVATIGLKDVVVIDTPDAVLICARDRAQDVKAIVERLQISGKDDYL